MEAKLSNVITNRLSDFASASVLGSRPCRGLHLKLRTSISRPQETHESVLSSTVSEGLVVCRGVSQRPLQAGNTNISLSQQPFPLSFTPVSEQRLACILWPGFQIAPLTNTMKRSLLSLVVLFIFSTRDKTHQGLWWGWLSDTGARSPNGRCPSC